MARQEAFQGSLPLLILKILVHRGPLHGYGITVRIQEVSEDLLRVEEGSLYPALHRMEEAGWIKAKWLTTENKRRARVYEITADGRKRLETEEKRWLAVNAALVRALKLA
jgi:transcriptional regulator